MSVRDVISIRPALIFITKYCKISCLHKGLESMIFYVRSQTLILHNISIIINDTFNRKM